MSLSEIVNEFEKETGSITSEQLASQLMNKENLSVKTEIPFSKDVELTALAKDMCDLVGDLFEDVKVIDDDGKLIKYQYSYTDDKGTQKQMSFGVNIALELKRKIFYSEEYAVSHKRKGRTEIVNVLGKRVEENQVKKPQQDTLGKAINR